MGHSDLISVLTALGGLFALLMLLWQLKRELKRSIYEKNHSKGVCPCPRNP